MAEDEKKEKNEKEETPKEPKNEEGQKSESEELKDRLLRLAAEFDNYKKRSSKDLDNAKKVGKAELAAKLLPILDEFEIAIESTDTKTEHGKGMAIVFSNFVEVMKKEGLKEIECSGVYDPYKHEIMMTKESNEKEGTILDVIRKGYLWNEIMLRPASVIVSSGEKKEEEIKK